MDFSAVCRTCLSDSNLQPIFEDHKQEMQYSAAIYVAAGIKVAPMDGLPQQICTSCLDAMNKYLEFRKQCKHVQTQLIKFKSEDTNKCNDNSQYVGMCNDSQQNLMKHNKPSKIETIDSNEESTEESNLKAEHTEYSDMEIIDEDPLKNLMEQNNYESQISIKFQKNEQDEYIIQDAEYLELESSYSDEKYNLMDTDKFDVETQISDPLDSGRVKCRLCSKTLLVSSMDHHMARKHPHIDSTTMVECDVCHKTMQKASLRLHRAFKHAGLKPVCEHCGRSFSNKYRLKEHYRSKHGYDKIKCDKCPFQTSTYLSMQNHERRHLGEKPFVCECGAKFHAAYLLAQHRQSHRDKLYKCDQCPKTFKVNNGLHLHKATCHAKAQVKCHLCDKTYSNRHYAVKHARQTHGYFGTVPTLEKVDCEFTGNTNEDGGNKKKLIVSTKRRQNVKVLSLI